MKMISEKALTKQQAYESYKDIVIKDFDRSVGEVLERPLILIV